MQLCTNLYNAQRLNWVLIWGYIFFAKTWWSYNMTSYFILSTFGGKDCMVFFTLWNIFRFVLNCPSKIVACQWFCCIQNSSSLYPSTSWNPASFVSFAFSLCKWFILDHWMLSLSERLNCKAMTCRIQAAVKPSRMFAWRLP